MSSLSAAVQHWRTRHHCSLCVSDHFVLAALTWGGATVAGILPLRIALFVLLTVWLHWPTFFQHTQIIFMFCSFHRKRRAGINRMATREESIVLIVGLKMNLNDATISKPDEGMNLSFIVSAINITMSQFYMLFGSHMVFFTVLLTFPLWFLWHYCAAVNTGPARFTLGGWNFSHKEVILSKDMTCNRPPMTLYRSLTWMEIKFWSFFAQVYYYFL